jgi:hypothetical protein
VSDKLAKWANAERQSRKSDRPQDDGLKPGERKALWKLRQEAKDLGSQLTSGGKGGLPPSLVLGVMRRDKYRCKTCGELGDVEENGGIGIHHKGGIVASKWLSSKGHSNDPNNLVTICGRCHDKEHEEAREEGDDSSQVTAEADEGDPRRDKGKPLARPRS